jgi:ADP-heptose:LPS heptosyltransferase
MRIFLKTILDSIIFFNGYFIKKEKHKEKRVLIFRKDVLGDFILFLPTLKHYKEYYKDYKITLIASKASTDLHPLLSFIDEIVTYDNKKFSNNPFYRRNFILNLIRKNFDIAIYPVYSREKIGDKIINSTGARERITFKSSGSQDKKYTRLIEVTDIESEIERNFYFLNQITNNKNILVFPTINIDFLNTASGEKIMVDNDLKDKEFVIIFPGAGEKYRIWQLEKFAQIANYLNNLGLKVVVCGTKDEKYLGERMFSLLKEKSNVNLIGKTDIKTMAFLLKNSKFYFGSETGILHLACAVGTPTIAILGGGHFERFFPYGDLEKSKIVFDKNMKCKKDNWNCTLKLKEGEIAPCIKNISIETAIVEIDKMLYYLK